MTIHADTIAAIATAIVPEQGSVGIVRVSGPAAVAIARQLFHAPGQQAWDSHRILYGTVRHPETHQVVDEALLLLMLAPRSYTREDVVEFQCHGGIMPVQQVLQLCIAAGARLAQPGEFSLRAFLNGRLDLTQAESIADLVGARSPQAAHLALAGLQGKLAQPIRQIRSTCIDILAEIEARIDFEEDLPPLDEADIKRRLQAVLDEVQQILATADRGELLRTGLKVAIVGRPNVGKSSLLNAWSRSDRAIVTDLPGTTRDVVESQLVVGGIPIQVLDTAGIRETSDQVEKIGVERSRLAAQAADLILFTIDAQEGWTAADQEIYAQVCDRPLILVINKIDLVAPEVAEQLRVQAGLSQESGVRLPRATFGERSVEPSADGSQESGFPERQPTGVRSQDSGLRRERSVERQWTVDSGQPNSRTLHPAPRTLNNSIQNPNSVRLSFRPERSSQRAHGETKIQHPSPLQVFTAAALNQGIDALEAAILDIVQAGKLQAANLDLAINQRQAAALTQAKQSLQQVQETIANQLPLDFWSIDLRSAISFLGQILGEDATESVLDQIFSRFCIGK